MELDLRVGSIFTRTQTLELQNRVAALAESMVSYGASQRRAGLRTRAMSPEADYTHVATLAQAPASSRRSASSSINTSA